MNPSPPLCKTPPNDPRLQECAALPKRNAPVKAGAKSPKENLLMVAPRHSRSLAFLCLDRDQESVPVGVRELVPLHIGAVFERAIQLETVVVLGAKVLHVLQYNSLPVCARL